MRLNINLASRPYLDVRRTLLRWGTPVLLLAICTAGLVWAATASWLRAREMDQKIVALHSQIAALEHKQESSLALLRLAKNQTTVETSKFMNELIARKSFSWTEAFMQLEKIMPARLRVVSITPHLQPDRNTVQVSLSVAGSSRDAAVDLVKRLEQSPSFRDARIVEEKTFHDKNSTDTVLFHLEATYVAAPASAAAAPPAARRSAAAQAPAGKAPAGQKPAAVAKEARSAP